MTSRLVEATEPDEKGRQRITVQLRRTDTSQPWGFRMKGGAQNQDMPLYLEHVAPNGRAAHAGLRTGDVILAIDRQPTRGFTHDQGKGAILRAGNELDIIVQRGGMTVHPMEVAQPEERSQIVEEPIAKLGGSTYKEVQPKTYQVLQSELDEGGAAQQAPPSAGPPGRPAGPPAAPPAPPPPGPPPGRRPVGGAVRPPPEGGRPASIFDRKREDRSGYLKASGTTIQKAYGQTQ